MARADRKILFTVSLNILALPQPSESSAVFQAHKARILIVGYERNADLRQDRPTAKSYTFSKTGRSMARARDMIGRTLPIEHLRLEQTMTDLHLPTTASSTAFVYSQYGADPDLGELVELFVEEMPDRIQSLLTSAARPDWSETRPGPIS